MTDNLHGVTQELLKDIERKDRRFRFTQTLFFVLLIGLVGTVLIVLYQNQNNTLEKLNHNAEQRSKQIRSLQEHIDCVVALLQHTNRQQLYISDIENCDIKQQKSAQTETANPQPVASNPQNESGLTQEQMGSVGLPPTNSSPSQTPNPPTTSAPPDPSFGQRVKSTVHSIGGTVRGVLNKIF